MSVRTIAVSIETAQALDNLAAQLGTTKDGAIRSLLGLAIVKPARPGRPAGGSKWPFSTMAVGDEVPIKVPLPKAALAAVYRAENGTGKRFQVPISTRDGYIRITRIA